MPKRLNILLIAAENDALSGAKVGGIGDVLRDTAPALAHEGCQVHVITPAYGTLARLAGSKKMKTVTVTFGGVVMGAAAYTVPAKTACEDVIHWVIDHPAFCPCGEGRIYCDDGPDRPFATDASKFALFCQLVANLIKANTFGKLDVIHLHDWHAAMLLVLRRYHSSYRFLRRTHCVYSIHNLSLQGIRPLRDDSSSVSNWFPAMTVDSLVIDPRWPDCINLMRAGINLADKVHAVSPTYAQEILQASDVQARGYFGGEGLELDLQRADAEGRLFGILNGCEYPGHSRRKNPARSRLVAVLNDQLWRWIGADPQLAAAHFIAERNIARFATRKNQVLVTSVGRVTTQKVRLLQQTTPQGEPVLHALLEELGTGGTYIFLGSGNPELEQFLTATAAQYDNFIFLPGFSDAVAEALYSMGNLFLMPSSYEPCGISQMLAMRAGQPCLVHRVGGLNDTVQHAVNGFSFAGESPQAQAQAFVEIFRHALRCKAERPREWTAIVNSADKTRFTWKSSVGRYLSELYV